MKNTNDTKLIDLNIISSIIFILASMVSLTLTFDEKNRVQNKKTNFSKKASLNISFYNRIVILIAVLISLYVGYNNYKDEQDNTIGKYKNTLLLSTNVLTLIGAITILYVSYLNKQEQSITISDIENPLI